MSGGFSVPFAGAAVWAATTGQNSYSVAVFVALSIGAAWIAAYRIWTAEHKARTDAEDRVRQITDEYVAALHLEKIDGGEATVLNEKGKKIGRTLQFQLVFRNVLGRPVEYRFSRITVDSHIWESPPGMIVSAHSETRFYMRPIKADFPAPKVPTHHLLQLDYTYGEPGNHSRSVIRIIGLTRHPNGDIAWVYEKNEDIPCR